MNLQSLLLVGRPWYLMRRIAYKAYEMRHPDEPWISQGAVRFCDAHLHRGMRGVEWGSGRSTAWFAQRLGHLVSVEHSFEWHAIVSRKLEALRNVDYRFVALDHPEKQPTVPRYDPQPRYVAVVNDFEDGSLDFAVVDGHYRQACVLAVLPKLRAGGLLLIDNTDWMPLDEWGVPSSYPIVHQSRNVMTQTTVWEKPLSSGI
ncbi:class I SAM-dependent methyltransferase [Pendulispora albinea]|uniref:Class I SAM-dependent methyltransferase n=1 Tax=Pendulispora albinea TaxID=2741071 RepID=A0ABZ2LL88_9BACT